MFGLGKTEDKVVEVLQKSAGKPMTLVEIAEQVGVPPKKVFKSLRKLFEANTVECDNKSRTYALAKK